MVVKMKHDKAFQKRPVVIKSESTGQLTAGKGITFLPLISNKPGNYSAMRRSRRTSIVDELEHVFISANHERTKRPKGGTYYKAKRKPKTKNLRRNASANIFSNLLEPRGGSMGPPPDEEFADDEDLEKEEESDEVERKFSGWNRLRDARKRETRRQQARERFRRAIRMVIIIQRALSFILKRHKRESREVMSFTEIADELETDSTKFSGSLSFDPRDYKAKKEINISTEVKHVLSLPSSARTSEQLQTALYGLQTIRSFAEYPLHMQEKLVKVAWFETIPPKRVIIRQGHFAENFYFVISGSVVVTIMDGHSGDGGARTAAVLRKGSSFGELALLHRSKRTANCSSQGIVQLLCVGRDDFLDIFMRGQNPGDEPEHIQYLRRLPFMKYWPIEKLLEHPEMCLFHFYKRGQVIVKDSKHTDWIYVVKSGTCQVLKQLKAVTPNCQDVKLPRLNSDKSKTRAKRKTGRKRSNTTVADFQYLGLPTLHDDQNTTAFSRLMSNDDPGLPHSTLIPRAKTVPDISSGDKKTASESWSLTQASSQGPSPRGVAGSSRSDALILPEITFDPRKGATLSRQSKSRGNFREISAMQGRSGDEDSTQDRGMIPNLSLPSETSSDDKDGDSQSQKDISVFVQIELLQRRDVFGLTTLSFIAGDHDQSSVSLVSNGAECIMIKKDYFAKHCSEIVRRNIVSFTRPYPSPTALQNNLQSHSDWSHYKTENISDIVQDMNRLKELHF